MPAYIFQALLAVFPYPSKAVVLIFFAPLARGKIWGHSAGQIKP